MVISCLAYMAHAFKEETGWVQFDFLIHAVVNAMFVYTQEWEA